MASLEAAELEIAEGLSLLTSSKNCEGEIR